MIVPDWVADIRWTIRHRPSRNPVGREDNMEQAQLHVRSLRTSIRNSCHVRGSSHASPSVRLVVSCQPGLDRCPPNGLGCGRRATAFPHAVRSTPWSPHFASRWFSEKAFLPNARRHSCGAPRAIAWRGHWVLGERLEEHPFRRWRLPIPGKVPQGRDIKWIEYGVIYVV
jgi:hypothetical protein